MSQDEWTQVLDVNLDGAFHVAQEAAAAMVRQERPGVLLFSGSWVGEVPSRGLLPYCVSKAGVQMLARCLALELAPHGIRANVVAPGVLDAGVSAQIFRAFPERRAPFQKIVPLGTLGTAEQVADAFVFLASDAAAYITGTFATSFRSSRSTAPTIARSAPTTGSRTSSSSKATSIRWSASRSRRGSAPRTRS